MNPQRVRGLMRTFSALVLLAIVLLPSALADGGRTTQRCEVAVCARVDAYDHGSCPGFGDRALGASSTGISAGASDACQSSSRTTSIGASVFLASVTWSSGSGTQIIAVCAPNAGCVQWLGSAGLCSIRFYPTSGPITAAPTCPVGPPAVPDLPYDTMPLGAVPYDAVPWALVP